MKEMIKEQYERAKRMLQEHSEGHHRLANLLIEREVIFAEDVEEIFGKRPWASRSEEIFEKNESNETNTNINEHETSQENVTESEASEKTTDL
jgi:cell division protease FtsH